MGHGAKWLDDYGKLLLAHDNARQRRLGGAFSMKQLRAKQKHGLVN